MKTIKKLVFVKLILLSFCLFAQSASTNTGIFEFEQETIDYGTIEQNSDGNRKFVFKNVGNAPIVISKVKSSCGCTVPTKPEAPVLPNETAEISIKYATSRLGIFNKSITIRSNTNEPFKVIKIKGKVIQSETTTLSNSSKGL